MQRSSLEISESVFSIFTKSKYSREKPFKVNELKTIIQSSVCSGEPISLVGFWGVGTKDHADSIDEKSVTQLIQFNKEVQEVYAPGLRLLFVLAIEHGIHNGVSAACYQSYIEDIQKMFTQAGFEWALLHDLWEKYSISFALVEELLSKKEPEWWSKVDGASLIENNAQKRNHRLSPLEGAQRYYIFRSLEKQVLEKEYSGCIFYTYSDSRLRSVLPDMPTLYLHSRPGWSDTPWFATEEQ